MPSLDVTVICANYNNGNYLHDLVKSINQQDDIPKEVIICDDDSTDNSVAIIESLQKAHSYLTLVRLKKNSGVANARNAAIDKARTKYIAILDSDDLICSNRLKKQSQFLENHKEIGLVGSNCIYFSDEEGKKIGESNFPENHQDILQYFRAGANGVLNGTVMIRREVLAENKYDQDTVWAEDYDLFSRLMSNNINAHNISEPLTKVRVHGSSATTNLKRDTIKKIYHLRELHFGIPYSEKEVTKEYKHILNYRKYLIDTRPFNKYLYLLKAIYYKPQKLIKRLFNN